MFSFIVDLIDKLLDFLFEVLSMLFGGEKEIQLTMLILFPKGKYFPVITKDFV
jgi:hypothetical protein